jgi:RNA polymerase sigma-70 factor (ECF subfamily)
VGNFAESEDLYQAAVAEFGRALERLASAYEADLDLRCDLLQDIHAALWRSLKIFDGRCSLRTWTFRVAHNAATSHVVRRIRHNRREWVSLETIEALPGDDDIEATANHRLVLERLQALIQELRPLDKQVILLYLEGLQSVGIAEITGISAACATTKIHRIKAILARRFHQGERDHAPGRNIRGSSRIVAKSAADDGADIDTVAPDCAPV